MNEVFSAARDATITAYNKYRHFYDRKASASPLKKLQYCLLLNPKLTNVNDHMGKSLTKWLPLYRVESVLTNSNYIIRKVGTNHTQCVHRIRIRPITPQYQVEDIPNVNSNNFTPDPITQHFSEPTLFDQSLPDLLNDRTFSPSEEAPDHPNVLFCYAPRLAHPPPPPPPGPLFVPPPPVVPPPTQLEHPAQPDPTSAHTASSPEPTTPPSFEYEPPAHEASLTTTHTTPFTTVTYTSSIPISNTSSQQGQPQIYSFPSSNSSSSFSGFADSFVDRAQHILDPPSTCEFPLSQIPGPSSFLSSNKPFPSFSPRASISSGPSRIPRPITPTTRGNLSPSTHPHISPIPSPRPFHTSTPISSHSRISGSPILDSNTTVSFTLSPPSLTPAPPSDRTIDAPSASRTTIPDLYDPYGHLALPPTSNLSERISRFYQLEQLREQEAQRLEAQAAALRNPLAARDSRLRQKPKKTGFFQSKPWK